MRAPETSSPRRAPAAGRHRLVLRRLLQQLAYCGACCRRRLIAAPIAAAGVLRCLLLREANSGAYCRYRLILRRLYCSTWLLALPIVAISSYCGACCSTWLIAVPVVAVGLLRRLLQRQACCGACCRSCCSLQPA